MDCCICFDQTNFYNCILCNTKTCKECCENFIENSNDLIICPTNNCNQYYIFNKNCLKNYEKYTDLLFKFLKNDNIDKLTIMKLNANLIHSIRNDRLEFIKSTKLPAILSFINIALKDKLKKVDKKNLNFIQNIDNKEKCYNIICDRGLLNKDFKCNECLTIFCKICKEQKNKNHKCDEKILSSLRLMKNFTKCPKCLVLIEKKDGCNAITCAVCKTNFDYISGDVSPFGNHGKSIHFNLKENYTLSKEYSSLYPKEIISLIQQIEQQKPLKNQNFNIIVKYMDKLLSEKETNKEKLCKLYYDYNMQSKEIKKYYNCLKKIEDSHNTKTLTKELLEEILKYLN